MRRSATSSPREEKIYHSVAAFAVRFRFHPRKENKSSKMISARKIQAPMKYLATLTLLFNLGVAGVYAQEWPVKMKFSGTNVATTINLQPNTVTDEHHSAGDGTFGPFTF